MMKDYTEKVKNMEIMDAAQVASNIKSVLEHDPETAITATLRLGSIVKMAQQAYEACTQAIEESGAVSGQLVEATAKVKSFEDGKLIDKELTLNGSTHDVVKTEIQSTQLWNDLGGSIAMDADQTTKLIKLGSPEAWKYYNDITKVTVKSAAVKKAIKAGILDPKYEVTTTTSKYEVEVKLI